jgi:outer membrane protein TolC
MKFRTFSLSLLGFICPFLALAQPLTELPLLPEHVFPQLGRILADAAQQSPRMVALRLDREIADADLLQAKAGLYPSINAFVQFNQTRDQREDIPGTLQTNKSFYSLTLNQPLFHWGDRRNTYRIGLISRKLAERREAEAYRLLAQEIRFSYLQLIVSKVRLDAVAFNRGQSEDALRLTEENLSKGVISDAEAFQPRIAAEQARLTYDQSEYSYAEARRQFKVLTGVDAPADEQLPREVPAVPDASPRIAALLNGFLAQPEPQTFAALNLKDETETARLSHQMQKTRLLPKFNLVLGVSQDEQSYTANLAAKYGLEQRYAGVSASWTLFDGFAARSGRISALARLRKAEVAYQQYSEAIAADAQRTARELDFAARNLRLQEKLLDSNRAFLNFRQDQITRGLASATEIGQAQLQYNTGLLTAIIARADYLQRVAEFVGLIATDPAVSRFTAPSR